MKYKLLPNSDRKKLEDNFMAAVRYKSLAGESHQADDVILINRNSAMNVDFLDGYSVTHPKVWFEYVTKDKSTDAAEKMVAQALSSVDAKQYKKTDSTDPDKSACPICKKMLVDVDGHIDRIHDEEEA